MKYFVLLLAIFCLVQCGCCFPQPTVEPSPTWPPEAGNVFPDYYSALGFVDLTASVNTPPPATVPAPSDAEIKRAFLRHALRVHPDKNPSTEAASMFQFLMQAKMTLLHHAYKRPEYDDHYEQYLLHLENEWIHRRRVKATDRSTEHSQPHALVFVNSFRPPAVNMVAAIQELRDSMEVEWEDGAVTDDHALLQPPLETSFRDANPPEAEAAAHTHPQQPLSRPPPYIFWQPGTWMWSIGSFLVQLVVDLGGSLLLFESTGKLKEATLPCMVVPTIVLAVTLDWHPVFAIVWFVFKSIVFLVVT